MHIYIVIFIAIEKSVIDFGKKWFYTRWEREEELRLLSASSRINLHIPSEMEDDRFCFFFVEVYCRLTSSLLSHETFCVAKFADLRPVEENLTLRWNRFVLVFSFRSQDSKQMRQ